jgi:hypothetical protein
MPANRGEVSTQPIRETGSSHVAVTVLRTRLSGGDPNACDSTRTKGVNSVRILLIQPKKPGVTVGGDDFAVFEPLALEYVAAGVEQDHEVRMIDQRLEDRVEETLQQFDPQVVGITAYTVHVNQVRRLTQRVKERNPGIFTVVGGHHATVAHRDFLSEHIDMIVLGEGTARFAEIVRRLMRYRLCDLPGLFWRLFKLNRRLHKLARDYADPAMFALRDARQTRDLPGPVARLSSIAPALPAPSAGGRDKRLPLPVASSAFR